MKKQEVKRLLGSARHAEWEMERIRERIYRLDALRKRVTPAYSKAPAGGSGNGSRIEDATAQILELEELLQEKVYEYLKQYRDVESAIALVEKQDAKAAEILRMRYLDGEKWEDIAAAQHYERTQVFRAHKRGISILTADKNLLQYQTMRYNKKT